MELVTLISIAYININSQSATNHHIQFILMSIFKTFYTFKNFMFQNVIIISKLNIKPFILHFKLNMPADGTFDAYFYRIYIKCLKRHPSQYLFYINVNFKKHFKLSTTSCLKILLLSLNLFLNLLYYILN